MHRPHLIRKLGINSQRYEQGTISARLVIGLVIVVIGFIYLADNMGLVDVENPGRFFWPAAFAAIGVTLLIEQRTAASKYWAYGWLTAAAIEFAYHLYIIPFGIGKLLFPIILLLVGGRIVQRAIDGKAAASGNVDMNGNAATSPTRVFAFLSAQQHHKYTQPLQNAEVTSILSGVKLDLTAAQIDGDHATVQVTAVMGGIEIVAPSEWSVVSEVTTVPGGFFDKRKPTAAPTTKTLYIKGLVIMGGVEVKN